MFFNSFVSGVFKSVVNGPKLCVRSINSDVNQVTLLGQIVAVRENSVSANPFVSLKVRTVNSFNTLDGRKSISHTHSVRVFDRTLCQRVKNLTFGNRVCVLGLLSNFRINEDWFPCVVARKISVLESESNTESEEDNLDQEPQFS